MSKLTGGAPRTTGLGTWQQPVMTLGVLLIVAALLLPAVGGITRWRLGEQADLAAGEFRKAVFAASDGHGRLLSALSGEQAERATEGLGMLAQEDPRRAMKHYEELQAGYAEWMAAQGRPDLQPTLDAAKQAYARALEADAQAKEAKRRHLAVLGQFLRYAGFAGASGLVLVLWAALTGLSRSRAKP